MKRLTLVLLAALFTVPGIAAADGYTVIDAYTLTGDEWARLNDINDAGQIVGTSGGDAFLWDPIEGMRNLSNIDDPTQAYGVSSDGRVVGGLMNGSHSALYWDSETPMTIIDDTQPSMGQYEVPGQAVNSSGQVAGGAYHYWQDPFDYGDPHAFLWNANDGAMQCLGTLGGTQSLARDINDAGQVVGWASLPAELPRTPMHAFLWDSENDMQDLGSLLFHSEAAAISDTGIVVGRCFESSISYMDDESRAFLWDEENGMRDLGVLDGAVRSWAGDVNDEGYAVGGCNYEGTDRDAFLWTTEGGMVNLNDLIDSSLGIDFAAATAINNHGDILATGYYGDDWQQHHFLLLADRGVVPEPASLTLMGMGLSALAVARLRRKRS